MGVARLSINLGWAKEEYFLILLLYSPIFPPFFLIFFLNLVLRVGSTPGKALATPLIARKFNFLKLWYFSIAKDSLAFILDVTVYKFPITFVELRRDIIPRELGCSFIKIQNILHIHFTVLYHIFPAIH